MTTFLFAVDWYQTLTASAESIGSGPSENLELTATQNQAAFPEQPLSWASRKQTSTARSTTEAEMVSLGAGLFLEALPMQELFELVFDRQMELICYQDHSAVIQIVAASYRPKSRHLNKQSKIK